MMHSKRLKIIFEFFDVDGSGSVSADEIIKVLMPEELEDGDMDIWNNILGEVDLDGSGEIDFYEF